MPSAESGACSCRRFAACNSALITALLPPRMMIAMRRKAALNLLVEYAAPLRVPFELNAQYDIQYPFISCSGRIQTGRPVALACLE